MSFFLPPSPSLYFLFNLISCPHVWLVLIKGFGEGYEG